MPDGASATPPSGQRLSWWALLGVVAVWVVASLAGALLGRVLTGAEEDAFSSTSQMLGHVALPAVAGIAVAVAVITRLRWWRPVLREEHRARPWSWVFPVGIACAGALGTEWSRLTMFGIGALVTLVVTALLISASEELAFRGIVLVALRGRYAEFAAAILTAVLFGLAHLLAGGFANLGQGVFAFVGGYLYYVARRVTGLLVGAVILHAWWDVAVLSNDLGPGSGEAPYFEGAMLLTALFVTALATYRWWQPRGPQPLSGT